MADFCPGYPAPFDALVADYPGEDVYPQRRLPGRVGARLPPRPARRLGARRWCSARTPRRTRRSAGASSSARPASGSRACSPSSAIHRSYAMVNTFLYSVYGQGGGNRHDDDEEIAAYRNRWLDALLVGTDVTAVVSLGQLADTAYQAWATDPAGRGGRLHHAPLRHPTYPESASRGRQQDARRDDGDPAGQLERRTCPACATTSSPTSPPPDTVYGTGWQDGDLVPIPHRGPSARVAGLVVRPGRLGGPDRSGRADQARDDQRRRAEEGPDCGRSCRHPPPPTRKAEPWRPDRSTAHTSEASPRRSDRRRAGRGRCRRRRSRCTAR